MDEVNEGAVGMTGEQLIKRFEDVAHWITGVQAQVGRLEDQVLRLRAGLAKLETTVAEMEGRLISLEDKP